MSAEAVRSTFRRSAHEDSSSGSSLLQAPQRKTCCLTVKTEVESRELRKSGSARVYSIALLCACCGLDTVADCGMVHASPENRLNRERRRFMSAV